MPLWIWILVTAGPAIFGAVAGVLGTHVLTSRARRRSRAAVIVRQGFDKLKGEFDKRTMPGLRMPTDGPGGLYYHLTAENTGTEEAATNCIPLVYFVSDTMKVREPGLWLASSIRQKDEDDEFVESIPPQGTLPFCCFAVSGPSLYAFDMDTLEWKPVAGSGAAGNAFRLIAVVSSSNARCRLGQEYEIEFDPDSSSVRIAKSQEVSFQNVNPDLYVGKMKL